MKYLSSTLLLIVLVSNSFFTLAQTPWTVYNIGNSDLPFNTIRDIKLDSADNIWVATDNGLAMFDRTNWTIYTTGNSDIPSNSIRSLNVDYNGDLWVGTWDDGVAKFDGTNWTVLNISNSGLPDNFVKAIEFDVNNNAWFGTTGGCAYYNGSIWTVWNNINSAFFANNVGDIIIDEDNVKYVGMVNGGLTIIDSANTNFTTFTSFDSNIGDNTLLDLAFDNSGILWAATPAGGLIAYNGNNSWQWFAMHNSLIPTNACDAVSHDPAGSNIKYLGTYDQGILVFDGIFSFTTHNESNSGIPENYITTLVKDDDGIIWAGTLNSGLGKWDIALDVEQRLAAHDLQLWSNVLDQTQELQLSRSVSDATIQLIDLNGKIIESQQLKAGLVIQLHSRLSAGIYLLNVIENEASHSFKLIKN
jgi:ligand-binding sensor domain-containing protein